ncbi:histidine--tRNA ligase [Candidatus Saccharibacteria bacterium]|nr:MAG: histidine--tRNA ligase [Candidatus Saccharibacteria bacterium]
MSSLSSDPYKGARDWYPEDMRLRSYIFAVWHKIARSYGYEVYDTPLLEPVDVYAAKSGQELVNEQTYQFVDRGERRVAIRPEMTPSVSRMIAARRQEVALPARWYNIGRFLRYERPQRGREREFWQLNCDIFGCDGVAAEAEIITMGSEIMKAFGAKDDMFTIRINNRSIIDYMMAHYLGLDTVQAQLMMKLFDRKNKIAPESFRDQAIDIFGPEQAAGGLQKIAQLLAARTMADLPESIRDSEPVRDIQVLFTYLERAGIKNAVFDITLMRGLDYYTGTVFEFYDTHPENSRSLFGGGRYDGLVGLFGAEPLSAVGFAPGLTMMQLFLDAHDLLPTFHSTTDIYMVVIGETMRGAMRLADELRAEGVNVELDITDRKLDKQLKTAAKKAIPYMLFVGEKELDSEVYPLKNTISGEEKQLSVARIVSTIRDHRQRGEEEFDIASEE